MAEWSNAAVLKTVDCNSSGGSNPSFSAKWPGEILKRPTRTDCKSVGKPSQVRILLSPLAKKLDVLSSFFFISSYKYFCSLLLLIKINLYFYKKILWHQGFSQY